VLGDDSAGGRAALAGRSEGRPQDAVRGQVQIRVRHDDDRVLAAKLEADALQTPARQLGDALAGRRVAGERDDLDVRRVDDGVPDLRAGARHEIDAAPWEARLSHELHEEEGAVRV